MTNLTETLVTKGLALTCALFLILAINSMAHFSDKTLISAVNSIAQGGK